MREAAGETPLIRYYRARHDRFKLLLKWRESTPLLQAAISELAPDAQIYVFGSALRDELTASSDIDVLIVTGKAEGSARHKLAAEMEAKLEEKLPHQIFELHVVEPRHLEWYKKHARELSPLRSLEA